MALKEAVQLTSLNVPSKKVPVLNLLHLQDFDSKG